MDRIIIKTTFDFDKYAKKSITLKGDKNRKKIDKYFKSKKVKLEFIDRVDNDNYVEVMYSHMEPSDKEYLEKNLLKKLHKKVAFIESDKRFFEVVDDFLPSVI